MIMEKPGGVNILPGMTATVVASRPDFQVTDGVRFVLPAEAVFADITGVPLVWVVDAANTVHKRAVLTGPLTGSDSIVVTHGLTVGDVVAVSAVFRLREGMTIRPVPGLGEAEPG